MYFQKSRLLLLAAAAGLTLMPQASADNICAVYFQLKCEIGREIGEAVINDEIEIGPNVSQPLVKIPLRLSATVDG